MAVYFGRPSPDMLNAPQGGAIQQLSGWIITLKAMGVIPEQGRVLADVIGTLPLLSRRPHAIMLLDVTSRKIVDDVYRLNTMQSAVVIDNQGIDVEIDRRVRDLLATYTDMTVARIERKQRGALTYYRLTDSRLPDWAVMEWGTHDKQFVAGLGEGAFGKVLDTLEKKSPALADDAWYAEAHEKCHGANSGIELFVDLGRIRRRVGEVVQGKPEQVLRRLNLQDAVTLLWTVGFDGPALHSEAMGRGEGGKDHYVMLTGPAVTDPKVAGLIPPEVTRYAAFKMPLPRAVKGAREAYIESQSLNNQDNIHLLWARVEREFGFDIDRDLVDRLGEDLVFHNWPPHPLGIPLLCTIWASYTGDRASMVAQLDRIMEAAQELMSQPFAQSRPANALAPRLVRDPDGIWYVQLGLIGPAIGVADGWLVIAYSKEAVRQNLSYLDQRLATHPH